jgi:hypothetical protein
MVHQLIYFSSATHSFCEIELEELLERSRRKNKLNGITGVLVYHDRTFLHLLEGDKCAVQSLYARIRLDPRHMVTTILSESAVSKRSFRGWNMGLLNADLTPLWELPGFTPAFDELHSFDEAVGDPSLVKKLFVHIHNSKPWRDAVDSGQGAAVPV